jgi:hypothetical protein
MKRLLNNINVYERLRKLLGPYLFLTILSASNVKKTCIWGVPEGRVYGRRLAFVSVGTIKRHHHHLRRHRHIQTPKGLGPWGLSAVQTGALPSLCSIQWTGAAVRLFRVGLMCTAE